jgi:ribosomal protein S10
MSNEQLYREDFDRSAFERALIEALRDPSPELLRALAEAELQAHVQRAREAKP